MGQTQSSNSPSGPLNNVFPIDFAQDRNLDKLSLVAARILNTPDIYDINNLSRPGVCGDYAVFLKKELTKKLLPYTVTLPDEDGKPVRTEVAYQSIRSSADEAMRKTICSDMVDTMLRVVAVVLACLSSMQVASPSRPRTLKLTQKQSGGGPTDVYQWLVDNGVIESRPIPLPAAPFPDGRPFIDVQIRLKPATRELSNMNFTLRLEDRRTNVVGGEFFVDATTMPRGGLRVKFLDPLTVSAGTSVLPMRIQDSLGSVWAAGALIKPPTSPAFFKSFYATTPEIYLDELLYHLFNQVIGKIVDANKMEKRTATEGAGAIFMELKSGITSSALSALQPTLATYFQGFTPGPPPAIPGFGAGFYPGAAAGIPQQPPAGFPYGIQQQPRPYPLALPAPRPGVFAPPAAPGYYHIPLSASTNIMRLFKEYAKIIPSESTPAVVRAYDLRGTMDPQTRTFRPNVCEDDYWTRKDLGNITPWATFQFLSTKNWEKLSSGQPDIELEREWLDFLNEMTSIYDGVECPTFVVNPNTPKLLQFMSFANIKETTLCAKQDVPYVGFRKIQDTVLRFQGLYAEHTKRMWGVLNSLISIIRDPERKIEVIRLNDAVLNAPSSNKYVRERAAEARRALFDYYTAVERTYVNAIKEIGKDLAKA